MASDSLRGGRVLVAVAVVAGLGLVPLAGAPQAPPGASPAKAKELGALLQSRKLEVFATAETGSKFVAVLHVPGVQLLLVSAAYGRPLDFEYRLFHKQYLEMYQELRSSPLAADKFVVEDVLADGLLAIPVRKTAPDVATLGSERRVFDGDFADPRRRNQNKIAQEDYFKAYERADERYTALLDLLIAAVKKASLAGPAAVR